MKILLIDPPYERFKGMITPYFPIGLGYLGAVLKNNKYDVEIYNVEKAENTIYLNFSRRMEKHKKYLQALKSDNNEIWQEVKDTIGNIQPDVIGITCVSVKYPSALKVAAIAKNINKNAKTILGGIHPTLLSKEIIKEKNIDFIVEGEGEKIFLGILKNLETGKFHNYSKIYKNKDFLEINRIPIPDRDTFLNKDRFHKNDFGALITSRGCPYNCSYCATNKIWGQKVRFRKNEDIIDEIQYLVKKYNTTQISFLDDVFSLNKEKVVNFSKLLIESNIKINWSIVTRLDLIDEELVTIMKEAGCNYIRVGVETGSKQILEITNRKMNLDIVRKNAKILQRSKIFWGACIIIGLPEEKEKDIKSTLEFVKEIAPHYITLSFFTPHPGTKYFEHLRLQGHFQSVYDYAKYDHHSPYNYFSENISKKRYITLVTETAEQIDSYNEIKNSLRENFYSNWRRT